MAPLKVLACTAFALVAFAGNSVLCRLALGSEAIDAASYTIVRLVSAIVVLLPAVALTRNSGDTRSKGSFRAAIALFVYAAAFSYGYISLDTGTGALVVFAAVQITMVLMSIATGSKLHVVEWLGLFVAFAGFAYLVAPELRTPSLQGFLLMSLSGAAWGFYTLFGRSSDNPLSDTAYNFLRTLPFVIVLMLFTFRGAHLTASGVWLAILSGAIASGAGYAIWYVAVKGLSVTQAAVVQLLVPVIAAFGGVLFGSESIEMRLIQSSALVLGGILIVTLGRYHFTRLKD